MSFIEYNANPYGANIDDCICRAITKATGKSYMEVFDGLIAVADDNDGWDIDELRTAWTYLNSIGWECCDVGGRWTVKQYTEQVKEPRLLVVNGHMTYSEGGNVFDTWNPNRFKIRHVFRKCIE